MSTIEQAYPGLVNPPVKGNAANAAQARQQGLLDVDHDVELQNGASELLAELTATLPTFLRTRKGTLKARVRKVDTYQLNYKVLSPFQELPQLLDPHLAHFVPMLADAFLEALDRREGQPFLAAGPVPDGSKSTLDGSQTAAPVAFSGSTNVKSHLLEPMAVAIAKLLYCLCKVRGEKVIARFFSVETKHIDVILSALEAVERLPKTPEYAHLQWSWMERYICFLWLSQLFLAPFDLVTLSDSLDLTDIELATIARTNAPDGSSRGVFYGIENFVWPSDLPTLAIRVLPLALKYLAYPGRESDGAKMVLVRLALRPDMRKLGLLDALINWALVELSAEGEDLAGEQASPSSSPKSTQYFYAGILSFLAGILRASLDTSYVLHEYVYSIFQTLQALPHGRLSSIVAVASTQKMAIKVLRSLAVLILQPSAGGGGGGRLEEERDIGLIETCIDNLLVHLSATDTQVRLAASKALSVITLRLDPSLASQVVEAVLEATDRNVRWVSNTDSTAAQHPEATRGGRESLVCDVSSVDPLEWHGLILTLSHLLYRRSPPVHQLPAILHTLLLGLTFEQRTASGSNLGANVRDASCFGIWAISRRYTTKELLNVAPDSIFATNSLHSLTSLRSSSAPVPSYTVLQILAIELLAAACHDPAGNIRRGASASLQELIGRHPNQVIQGINLVQTVDYHTISLRSRALGDVSLAAASLSRYYGKALFQSLLGWRGIGDAQADSRRVTAKALGKLAHRIALYQATEETHLAPPHVSVADPVATVDGSDNHLDRDSEGDPWTYLDQIRIQINNRIQSLASREVNERHGLFLAYASILDQVPVILAHQSQGHPSFSADSHVSLKSLVQSCIQDILAYTQVYQTQQGRLQQLMVEGMGALVVSSLPIVYLAIVLSQSSHWEASDDPLSGFLDDGSRICQQPRAVIRMMRRIWSLSDPDSPRGQSAQSLSSYTIEHSDITSLVQFIVAELPFWLQYDSAEVYEISSLAAVTALILSCPAKRHDIVNAWLHEVATPQAAKIGHGYGFFHAILRVFPLIIEDPSASALPLTLASAIGQSLLDRWDRETKTEVNAEATVDVRVALLEALQQHPLILQRDPSLFLDLLMAAFQDYTTTSRGDVGSLLRAAALQTSCCLWETLLAESSEPGPPSQPHLSVELQQSLLSMLFHLVLRLGAEKLDRVRQTARSTLCMLLDVDRLTNDVYSWLLPSPSSSPAESALGTNVHPPPPPTQAQAQAQFPSYSSKAYFAALLRVAVAPHTYLHPRLREIATASIVPQTCLVALLSTYVRSAETGNEALVLASRDALDHFCHTPLPSPPEHHQSPGYNAAWLGKCLVENLRTYQPIDRVTTPTLEILSFLLRCACFDEAIALQYPAETSAAASSTPEGLDLRRLCLWTQKLAYKSGNVKKIEACMRVYASIALLPGRLHGRVAVSSHKAASIPPAILGEARKRLGALLFHPWPHVRLAVAEEMWNVIASTRDTDHPGADVGEENGRDDGHHPALVQQKQKEAFGDLWSIDWSQASKDVIRTANQTYGFA